MTDAFWRLLKGCWADVDTRPSLQAVLEFFDNAADRAENLEEETHIEDNPEAHILDLSGQLVYQRDYCHSGGAYADVWKATWIQEQEISMVVGVKVIREHIVNTEEDKLKLEKVRVLRSTDIELTLTP